MTRSCPLSSTRRVARALRLEVVARLGERQLGGRCQLRDHRRREPGRGVDAGADRGAAQGQLRHSGERRLEPLDAVADLRGVAGELLAQRHRRRVHEVRAPRLHDRCELPGLALERHRQPPQRRDEGIDHAIGRRQVDRRREDVVARLAGVDLVVGVDRPAQPLGGEVGDHLVGVHVGRGARSRSGTRRSGSGRPSPRPPPRERRSGWLPPSRRPARPARRWRSPPRP